MSTRTIINKTGNEFDYRGSTTVAAGASAIIWTNGFPGTIGIIGGDDTVAFMVSAITDDDKTIIADDHTLFDLAEADYTASRLVPLVWGIAAYEVSNTAGSDPITVNWRIIRP